MILTRVNLSKRIEIVARLVIADLLMMKPYNEDYGKELKHIQSLFDELTLSKQEQYRHYAIWLAYLSSRFTAFYLKVSSTAFPIISKAIRFAKEDRFQIKYFEGILLWTQADIKSGIGEYQESITDYTETIELFKRLNNDMMIITPMANLTNVYRYLGHVDQALELCIEISKIAEKLDSAFQRSASYITIGMLFNIKGDFTKAKSYYEKAMTYVQEKNSSYLLLYNIYIHLLLDMKEYEQAEKHLPEFYQLSEELGSQPSAQWIKALYLKETGVNFETKAQAQRLFRELLETKNYPWGWDFHSQINILFHLIDLLLEEAKTLGSSSKIQEVNILINQATEMAQQKPRALIQVYLLQAKMLLIEGKVDESLSLIDKTYNFAKSKKLNLYAEQAKNQKYKLKNELIKWKGIIESNASLTERLELTDVTDYLQTAIRLRNLSGSLPTDLQEDNPK
jgi:ATP/maltotriose-dependent transcriptional regulator MalT